MRQSLKIPPLSNCSTEIPMFNLLHSPYLDGFHRSLYHNHVPLSTCASSSQVRAPGNISFSSETVVAFQFQGWQPTASQPISHTSNSIQSFHPPNSAQFIPLSLPHSAFTLNVSDATLLSCYDESKRTQNDGDQC